MPFFHLQENRQLQDKERRQKCKFYAFIMLNVVFFSRRIPQTRAREKESSSRKPVIVQAAFLRLVAKTFSTSVYKYIVCKIVLFFGAHASRWSGENI